MKATWFAVFLSLIVISLSAQAVDGVLKPSDVLSLPQKNEKINLNKADVLALTNAVKGIGKKRAEAIINYRDKHGSYKSIEELAQVRGIGERYVKNNLAQLQEKFAVG